MSTHPNAILLLELIPEGLSRKTHKAIMAECEIESTDEDFKIGDFNYHHAVMESEYLEGYQISADEGSIVIFDMITYGYGERKEWDALSAQKLQLEEWARGICERHHCAYKIAITANYW